MRRDADHTAKMEDRAIDLMWRPWDALIDIYGMPWPVTEDKVALVTAIIDVEFPECPGRKRSR